MEGFYMEGGVYWNISSLQPLKCTIKTKRPIFGFEWIYSGDPISEYSYSWNIQHFQVQISYDKKQDGSQNGVHLVFDYLDAGLVFIWSISLSHFIKNVSYIMVLLKLWTSIQLVQPFSNQKSFHHLNTVGIRKPDVLRFWMVDFVRFSNGHWSQLFVKWTFSALTILYKHNFFLYI